MTKTGKKNFEHGTNLDNCNNRIFLINELSKLLLPTFTTLVERSSPLVEGTDLEDVLSFFGVSFKSETLLKGQII